MKPKVWYSEVHDEIMVESKRGWVERGCQAVIEWKGLQIRDHCNLYMFKILPKQWKMQKELGWLINLGEL